MLDPTAVSPHVFYDSGCNHADSYTGIIRHMLDPTAVSPHVGRVQNQIRPTTGR